MLTDFYHPVQGGLERQVAIMARALRDRGHEAVVVTQPYPGRPDREVVDGVRVHRLAGWNRALGRFYGSPTMPFHPTVADPGFARRLDAVLAAERPDVVHAHGWAVHSATAAKRVHGSVPLVLSLHDYGLFCTTKTALREPDQCRCPGPAPRRCLACVASRYGPVKGPAMAAGLVLSRRRLDRVDLFVANSAAVAEASVAAVPAIAGRITSLSPMLAGAPPAAVDRPAIAPGRDYVLLVGRLSPAKGVDVALAAYPAFAARAALALLGPPQADTPAGARAHVIAPGAPHDVVLAAMRHASVVIVPSRSEGFGQVASEAMLMGRPVVASATGGLPEVVGDDSGLLVPPGDAAALAGAVGALLDDPERRRRMGEAGRRRAHRLTADVAGDRLVGIYDGVLDRRAVPT
jgi:glycosyltransferase involved in cell wall biosynthesis